MQDMGPRDRSIRNIPVPKSHRHGRDPAIGDDHRRPVPHEHEEEGEEIMSYEPPRPVRTRARGGRRTFWIIISVVVLLCAVGGFMISILFAGASVTVFERTEAVTPPQTLTASLNPPTGSLGHAIMSGTRSATTTVPATGIKEVSRAASGVITVYNAFSVDVQRLIARTRFESPDGRVYRIQESIDVPGATKSDDGTLTPGIMTVTAYADGAGASYNSSDKAHYTLPALKGDPRYDKIYAEGEAVTGGFEGQEPSIAEADLTRAQTALQQGLAQAAQSALAAQVPAGYLVVPGSLDVVYSDIAQTAGDSNTATISQTATMQAAIVKIDDLANAVAKQTVAGYNGEAVTFADPAQLVVEAQNIEASETELTLNLTGNLTLKWRYDPNALKSALVGKNKDEFETIIKSFAPAIDGAEAKIRPFWDGNFPEDPEAIEIITGER